MKKVLLIASIMVMTASCICNAAPQGEFISKTLFKDAEGGYHYVQSAEAKSIMKTQDISKGGIWIVPEPSKMGFLPRPPHEVMDMTEEEWMQMMRGSDGQETNAE